jgi:hypothetical protein
VAVAAGSTSTWARPARPARADRVPVRTADPRRRRFAALFLVSSPRPVRAAKTADRLAPPAPVPGRRIPLARSGGCRLACAPALDWRCGDDEILVLPGRASETQAMRSVLAAAFGFSSPAAPPTDPRLPLFLKLHSGGETAVPGVRCRSTVTSAAGRSRSGTARRPIGAAADRRPAGRTGRNARSNGAGSTCPGRPTGARWAGCGVRSKWSRTRDQTPGDLSGLVEQLRLQRIDAPAAPAASLRIGPRRSLKHRGERNWRWFQETAVSGVPADVRPSAMPRPTRSVRIPMLRGSRSTARPASTQWRLRWTRWAVPGARPLDAFPWTQGGSRSADHAPRAGQRVPATPTRLGRHGVPGTSRGRLCVLLRSRCRSEYRRARYRSGLSPRRASATGFASTRLPRTRMPPGCAGAWLSEIPTQQALKGSVLAALESLARRHPAESAAAQALAGWIATLPATGRVPVPLADARWLEANPASDPILAPGDTVDLPRRVRSVTIVSPGLGRCQWPTRRGGRPVLSPGVRTARGRGGRRLGLDHRARRPHRARRRGVLEPGRGQRGRTRRLDLGAAAREAWSEALSVRIAGCLATQGSSGEAGAGDAVRPVPAIARPAAAGPAPEGTVAAEAGLDGRSRTRAPTASDLGYVGLLQTPTARSHPGRTTSASISPAWPTPSVNVFLQPFDWLEGGFRYTDVANRDYGRDISTLDLQGQEPGPQGATAGGIGLGAGRSRSASATWAVPGCSRRDARPVQAHRGAGLECGAGLVTWAARRSAQSPVAAEFAILTGPEAGTQTGQGGTFGVKTRSVAVWACFGGVQRQSPWAPLLFKLEYDGNNYRHAGPGHRVAAALADQPRRGLCAGSGRRSPWGSSAATG